MENNRLIQGQDFEAGFEEQDEEMVIYAEKNMGIYLAETYEVLKRAIFYAARTLSSSAFKVYYCFEAHSGFSYPGRVKSKKVAELCGIHIDTFYKARKELITSGLIYKIPKHRVTDPDRIYVSNVLHGRIVQEKNLNDVIKENFSNELSHVIQSDGSQTHAKVLKTSVINEPPKVLQDSYSSLLPLQKESDMGATVTTHTHTHDREAFDKAFEPNQTVGYINAIEGMNRIHDSFKLTPPKAKARVKPIPKKKRAFSQIPSGFLNQFIDFCYNIKTHVQRHMLVDGVIIGRCSTAIGKLVGAGADLTQFEDFKEKWRALGWTKTPSPEMIVRNWFRVLNDDPVIDNIMEINTAETRTREEQERDIDEFMLKRAERIRNGT